MKSKPVIGITSRQSAIKPFGSCDNLEITLIPNKYLQIITDREATPFIISENTVNIDSIVEIIDGLILIGGNDVSPNVYGESCNIDYSKNIEGLGEMFKRPSNISPNENKDLFDIELYNCAKYKKIPILGICRGMQIINVAEGGSLHQEFESSQRHLPKEGDLFSYHNINIRKNTLLSTCMIEQKYTINSAHHQSIKTLGKNLLCSALSDDETVEAIEHRDYDFIVGLQNHPEHEQKKFASIFNKFIECVIEVQHSYHT